MVVPGARREVVPQAIGLALRPGAWATQASSRTRKAAWVITVCLPLAAWMASSGPLWMLGAMTWQLVRSLSRSMATPVPWPPPPITA